MNDFERRLTDALKRSTEGYRPSDPYVAKERFMQRYRRRRIAFYGAGVALAGAAVAAALLVVPDQVAQRQVQPLPPAQAPAELIAVPVGDRPTGVAFGDEKVWVANSGDGTVSVIDPLTNEVLEGFDVGGDPDDVTVGVGAAWVADSGSGVITKIPLGADPAPERITVGEGGRGLDVAPGSGAVWVVVEDAGLFKIDPSTNDLVDVPLSIEPRDVAAGQGTVFVLGRSELVLVDPETLDETSVAQVSPSENQDLQLSDGALWVANGDAGEVTRFDIASGERSDPIYVGGNFTSIASGEGFMWMLSGDEGPDGVLSKIDPDSGEVVGGRTSLGGRPLDLTTGASSVWVVNQLNGTVSRLDPNTLPSDDEQAEADDVGRPLFAFSADGDIYVEEFEGRLHQVTDDPAPELFPSLSPDANTIAFQRGISESPKTQVVLLDLLTGDEEVLGPGERPSYGPDGRLAYLRWGAEEDRFSPAIVITRPGSDDNDILISPDGDDDPLSPVQTRNISWDLTGDYIYYEAGWEGMDIFQADAREARDPFKLVPGETPRGTLFSAPTVRGRDSVHVITVCCQARVDDPLEDGAELGLVRFTEGGPQYSTVQELDLGEDPAFLLPVLTSAGQLELQGGSDEERSWRQGAGRSWMLSTERGFWLFEEGGELVDLAQRYDFRKYAGVTVAAQFR